MNHSAHSVLSLRFRVIIPVVALAAMSLSSCLPALAYLDRNAFVASTLPLLPLPQGSDGGGTTTTQTIVYATNTSDSTISEFTTGNNGALVSIGSVTAGSNPNGIAIDPTGKYVYAANFNDNAISQYSIATGGDLIPMSPPSVAAGSGPYGIAIDPTGKYVYVTNYFDHTISQYTIAAGGNLISLSPASVTAGGTVGPYGIAAAPSGKFLYVGTYNAGVQEYTIDGTTGALTPMSPASISAGIGMGLTIDPTGKYAYATDYNNPGRIYQYTIDSATGGLSHMSPSSVGTGTYPYSIAVDPAGKHAYVVCQSNIYLYTIGSGGALSLDSVAGGLPVAKGIAIDPSGQYAYVNGSSANVYQYTIDSFTGGLSSMSPSSVAAGSAPTGIAIVRR